MNWSAIAAIAELFGAIGVIASLLYLARQMRNGAADARRAAAQAVLAKMNTVYERFSSQPQLSEVYVRGSATLSALTPAEAMQFSAALFSVIRPYEELLFYKRAGALEDWVWESVELFVLQELMTPGGLEWWAKRKGWFTPAFQAHLVNVLPVAAVETLTALEQAVVGENFRSGVLTETVNTAPPPKEV